MSHELRTPLNAIIGFGEMMHREIMGPIGVPAYKEYAQHIHESGMHLLSLVEEMLDLSKVEAGKLQIERVSTQPGTLFAESLVMPGSTAAAAKVEIVVDGDPSSWPMLEGDPVKLKQVFVNLIGNAIKFTPVGGVSRSRATSRVPHCAFISGTLGSASGPRTYLWWSSRSTA